MTTDTATRPEPTTPADDPDAHLREQAAAVITGLSVRTLQGYRSRGGGPPYVRIGTAVRYRRGSLLAWLRARETSTEPTPSTP